jgi:hypothetical protein
MHKNFPRMKRKIKKILAIILAMMLVQAKLVAQEIKEAPDKQLSAPTLSTEQIAAIKEIRGKQIVFRNAFRESLTGSQLDILTNPALTREEKLKSFRASLSSGQLRMIKNHRNEIRAQNFAIRSTLSDRQRMGIRRMAMAKAQQNMAFFQRVRMRNRHPGI